MNIEKVFSAIRNLLQTLRALIYLAAIAFFFIFPWVLAVILIKQEEFLTAILISVFFSWQWIIFYLEVKKFSTMKKLYIFFAVLVVIATAAFTVNKLNENKKQEAMAEKLNEANGTVELMINRYDAKYEWIKERRRFYIADMQEAWIHENPTLFIGRFKDMIWQDGKLIAIIFAEVGRSRQKAMLRLECDKASLLLNKNDNPRDLVAVIATISSVREPFFEREEDRVSAVANGKCIDIKQLKTHPSISYSDKEN